MGLFTKLRSRLGMLRTRGTSIGARFVSRFPPKTRGVLGKVGKIVRFGARITPIGRVVTIGLLGATAISAVRRRGRERKRVSAGTAISGVSVAGKVGRLAGLKRVGLIAAGIGAAAFVAEQIAEKLGIRGGAGFVGRKPPKAPTRRKKRRKKKVKGIRRHRHKIVRLKARTVVRSIRPKKSKRSRKGKRVSFTTAQGKKVSFIAR